MSNNIRAHYIYLLVCSRTDVYPERFATRLELVGDCHVVAEQAVSRHFYAHHAGQYRSGVQSDSHLQTRRLKNESTEPN
jgi:hypothetical protein